METAYWANRWQAGEIGFHRPEFNQYLVDYWPQIDLDLHWLAEQGHEVVGNEVVGSAVESFFADAGMTAECSERGDLQDYSSGQISILCGDFFALDGSHLEGVTGWYDRAAQVALPPAMRQAYYEHLARLLPAGAVGLSLGFEYPQEQKDGPPFSVEEEEIRQLCHGRFSVELLAREDRLAHEPRLVEKGLTRADETIYRLVRI